MVIYVDILEKHTFGVDLSSLTLTGAALPRVTRTGQRFWLSIQYINNRKVK